MVNEHSLEHSIAIIGMSGRFPGAPDVETFWQNLRDGTETIRFFSDEELIAAGIDEATLGNPSYVKASGMLDGIELFDAAFFDYSPREAEMMDPQQRIFLECAWHALEHAGYAANTSTGLIGVYAGSNVSTYLLINLASHPELIASFSAYQTIIANDKDHLPTRVSYKLNLKGPSLNINTACSTSLVAVHVAAQSVLNGECDLALAGGVAINKPNLEGYWYHDGSIVSPDGHCRAFDANAQGTVDSSGVGVVVLKRLPEALADGDTIHAVIRGSAINNDGALKVGYTAPSVDGQATVIEEALAVAQVDPDTIDYVETHGTGTILGDPIEIAALTQAFRNHTEKRQFCAIGSVKTNIGHLGAAAGVAGLIKTVQTLKHRQIPPSLHFQRPNPKLKLADSPFFVNTQLRTWPDDERPRRASVSSFGVGGTNAHVVLEAAPEPEQFDTSRPWHLLLLSAKTDTALDAATTNILNHLKEQPTINLADVAYTLQVGRCEFNHRRMLVCQNIDDAVQVLEQADPERVLTRIHDLSKRPVVFMFPGQGTQYPNMAREVYQVEPKFRAVVDRCAELLRPHIGLDLRDLLFPKPEEESAVERLSQTWLTQPALFVIEYALAKLLMSWGVRPQAMIGHSIGEYVAACLAEVFSLEDALALVALRGRLIYELPVGAMLSVALPEDQVQSLLGPELSLAAVNGPALCVVAGTLGALEELEQRLIARDVDCRRLHTSHAFHSTLMEPILTTFAEQVAQFSRKAPKIPYLSNVTGNWITADEATDPNYWARHLRQPVRFSRGLQTLLQEAGRVLLEVGPGRTLSTLVQQHRAAGNCTVLQLIRRPLEQHSDEAFLLGTVGKLWLMGVQIDWTAVYADERRHRIPLPMYPFRRQRYWIEPHTRTRRSAPAATTDVPAMEATETQTASTFFLHPRSDSLVVYVPPTTQLERTIANIWQDLLGVEQIGLHDNFFDLGGHSLLASRLILRAQEALQMNIPLRILFETPTVQGMVQSIQQLQVNSAQPVEHTVDLRGDLVLDESIAGGSLVFDQARAVQPEAVFLTGATGFLGGFLLSELLQQTSANVYCLVRASSAAEGLTRIKHNLERYLISQPEDTDRIIPVLGDLARPGLGLPEAVFDDLAHTIDAIYHNGAVVNFVYPYSELRVPNVLGTHEVLRLATRVRLKPVHFVSTLYVYSDQDTLNGMPVEEQRMPDHGEHLRLGYNQSKWVAERLITIAQSRGVPVTIYRPGSIAGHTQTGACQTRDFHWLMIKACIEMQAVPDIDMLIDIVPVDYVSKAIVWLSQQTASFGQAFHLCNANPSELMDLTSWIRQFGYPLELLSFQVWLERLAQAARQSDWHTGQILLPLLSSGPGEAHTTAVRVSDRQTQAELQQSGISCPPLSRGLFLTYLSYFVHAGFLDPVPTALIQG